MNIKSIIFVLGSVTVIMVIFFGVNRYMYNQEPEEVILEVPTGSYNPITPPTPNPIHTPTPTPAPPTSVSNKCYVGGCSGQLCTDKPDAISTCEYSQKYACYQGATCERQSNGECGWTQTSELSLCLSAY